MALAHVALRNVLIGVAVLAVAGVIVAGVERWDGDGGTTSANGEWSDAATTTPTP